MASAPYYVIIMYNAYCDHEDVGDNWIAALDNSEVLKERSDHEHFLQSNGVSKHDG